MQGGSSHTRVGHSLLRGPQLQGWGTRAVLGGSRLRERGRAVLAGGWPLGRGPRLGGRVGHTAGGCLRARCPQVGGAARCLPSGTVSSLQHRAQRVTSGAFAATTTRGGHHAAPRRLPGCVHNAQSTRTGLCQAPPPQNALLPRQLPPHSRGKTPHQALGGPTGASRRMQSASAVLEGRRMGADGCRMGSGWAQMGAGWARAVGLTSRRGACPRTAMNSWPRNAHEAAAAAAAARKQLLPERVGPGVCSAPAPCAQPQMDRWH